MLIVNRYEKEPIQIVLPDGRMIEFTVIRLPNRMGRFRVGIMAPPDVKILHLDDARPSLVAGPEKAS